MDFKIHENTWWWGKCISIIESCGNACVDIKFEENSHYCAYIEGLIVGTNVRRQGIGTELIVLCERLAYERGCSYIELLANKEQKWLVDWYKRLGFQVIYVYEHEYRMLKKIDKEEIKK